jgi:integrase
MRKPSKPWYRAFNDTWYVCLNGKQTPLAKGEDNKKKAERAFHLLMAGETPEKPGGTPVVTILDLFLDHSRENNKPRTFQWYREFLQSFTYKYPNLTVEELKPFHVTKWLSDHPDWKTARWGAITAIKRAFNWAVEQEILASSPIKKIKKPKMRARERFVTPEERQKIFDNYREGDCFRDFLFALNNTACRPGEVSMVTAAHVNLDLGIWVFEDHKTDSKTAEERIVILTPEMIELTKRLMEKRPTGPIFCNEDGNPWNRHSIRCRFRRVRKKLKLGSDLVAYLYRHAVCTDLLESGTGIAQAAEILGHKGTGQIMKHYSKLRQRREHLREQLKKARA